MSGLHQKAEEITSGTETQFGSKLIQALAEYQRNFPTKAKYVSAQTCSNSNTDSPVLVASSTSNEHISK